MRTKADKQEFRPKRKRGIRVATLVASGAVAAGGMFLSAGAASASPLPESPAVSTVVQQGDHGPSYKHYDKHDHRSKDKRDHHGKGKHDHHGKGKNDHHGKDKRDRD
ncbi:hypothetical protein K4749_11170 [Streptomyces sp. TRM72054]|uniref:hypothetical protein n=1 Tax=Streptomyces sp. TRM72054 TaxID=2870562 RepID=UPI001C8B79EA|nr:hypothetical protein [Streptomyces sp. TRM72054]MBX9394141.1 hypothetical protein [Streptomyces sp. TRM72054]